MEKRTIILYTILVVLATILGMIFAILDMQYYTSKCEKIVADVNRYYEATTDCYMVLERPVMYQIIASIGYILITVFFLGFLLMIKEIFFEELF